MTTGVDRSAGKPSALQPATDSTLLQLGESRWVLWSQVMVRSAGFPVSGMNQLVNRRLAEAADELAAGATTRRSFERLWQQHLQDQLAVIGDIARNPRFRLAIGWQNQKLLETAIGPLLGQIERQDSRNRKLRAREQLVTAYWQRYCLKSESIGFFGPTAWAPIGEAGPSVLIAPGPTLVERATVFFESWPIVQLAKELERTHDLGPWLAPRRAPHIQVGADKVLLPNGGTVWIEPLTMAILRAADGTLPASELALRLAAEHPPATPDEVYQQFIDARRRGWLIWKLELSPTLRPELELRAHLNRASDEIRNAGLAALERLEQARADVAEVCFDPDRLGPALMGLDSAFVEVTGQAVTRNEGQAYGGRTLSYLECRRDVRVELGPGLVTKMAPLGLVLDSIRWMLHRVRHYAEASIRESYLGLLEQGIAQPNATMLYLACAPILGGELRRIVAEVLAEAQRRWQVILQVPDGTAAASYRAEELRDAVARAFANSPAGWTDARWCSPDMMIAAESAEALRAGRYQLVLGEIHAGANTLDYRSMIGLHRCPAEMYACIDRDHPQPRLLIALPRESRPRLTIRSQPELIRDFDYHLVLMPHMPQPTRGRVVVGADVAVVAEGEILRMVLPDGARFDVMDLFTGVLKGEVAQVFDLYPPGYRPRITIDDMVVSRQRWSIPATEFDFALLTDEAERFLAARKWLSRHQLPRQVFVKSPLETKPFYVDFASTALVELLAGAARRAVQAEEMQQFSISEMLPTPEQTWLTDAAGERYVAELRLVAFDGVPSLHTPY